jgi:hypothetical protein
VTGTGLNRVMAIILWLVAVATGEDLTQLSVEELMNVRYTSAEYGLRIDKPLRSTRQRWHDLGGRTPVFQEQRMLSAVYHQLPDHVETQIETEASGMRSEYDILRAMTIEAVESGRPNRHSRSGPLFLDLWR